MICARRAQVKKSYDACGGRKKIRFLSFSLSPVRDFLSADRMATDCECLTMHGKEKNCCCSQSERQHIAAGGRFITFFPNGFTIFRAVIFSPRATGKSYRVSSNYSFISFLSQFSNVGKHPLGSCSTCQLCFLLLHS